MGRGQRKRSLNFRGGRLFLFPSRCPTKAIFVNTFSASRSRNLLIHEVTVMVERMTLPLFTKKTRDATRASKESAEKYLDAWCRSADPRDLYASRVEHSLRRASHRSRSAERSPAGGLNCAKMGDIVRRNDRARAFTSAMP